MAEPTTDVGNKRIDALVMVTRSALNAVPWIGGVVSEIVGAIIPGQRLDRIADFLRILSEKVADLEQKAAAERMKAEPFTDLLEDGLVQASRALTDERKNYIASLLRHSLDESALRHDYQKRLLQVLGELNDTEIVILRSLEGRAADRKEFFERHKKAVLGPRAYIGSDQDHINEAAVHETYRVHLRQLGLIAPRYDMPKKDNVGVPEFDLKTGMIKARSDSVTILGRLLLGQIDAIPVRQGD